MASSPGTYAGGAIQIAAGAIFRLDSGTLTVPTGVNVAVTGDGTLQLNGRVAVALGGTLTVNLPVGGVRLSSTGPTLQPNGTLVNTGLIDITNAAGSSKAAALSTTKERSTFAADSSPA